MSSHKQLFQDKRKSSRFSVTNNSAVMLSLVNVISYHVLDISKTGLSFCYTGKVNKMVGESMNMILFSDTAARSVDIPVQIINDTELDVKHLPDQFKQDTWRPCLRRCGVKFNQLSLDQEETITSFISPLKKQPD